jgi:SseB protein N-terminal domain
MRLLDRLMGGDEEERAPDVRSLHAAMTKAADHPSPEANAALFARLAEAYLWTVTVGQPPSLERLTAQARLSGHADMEFRAGRTDDGETYFPTATTRRRLARSGLGQPGDAMVRLPFQFLADAARQGLDTLVINPGTVPFGHIAAPALATFADGGIPHPAAPDRLAKVRPDRQGPLEPLDADTLPAGLLDAAIVATSAEPGIVAASLVVRSLGGGRVFVILAVVIGDIDRNALNDRLGDRVVGLIGHANYFAVEYVAEKDPRLNDPKRAAILIAG